MMIVLLYGGRMASAVPLCAGHLFLKHFSGRQKALVPQGNTKAFSFYIAILIEVLSVKPAGFVPGKLPAAPGYAGKGLPKPGYRIPPENSKAH